MIEEPRQKELLIQGIAASPGSVLGLAYLHSPENGDSLPQKANHGNTATHLASFSQAKQELIEEWKQLIAQQNDDTSKAILEAQAQIIRDPELGNRIKSLIKKEQLGVQQAIQQTFEEYITIFAKSGSPVVSERIIDFTDIRDRLMEATGHYDAPTIDKKGEIAVAQELSPREVITLSNIGVKGIITERGGHTSHAAIIARSMGIPAVMGATNITRLITDQPMVGLNGNRGTVYINPTEETRTTIQEMAAKSTVNSQERDRICNSPPVTADDHPFTLRANIEFAEELAQMEQCGGKGVGLLRTEAIYLYHDQFSDRATQQPFYEDILSKTNNNPVTIRLFDLGGDKFPNDLITEDNPFLGWRGIRMLLDERELLRKQLTAIIAAAGHYPGQVKLLVPMVTMLSEIDEIKQEIAHCKQQLIAQDEPIDDDIPLGIMVETPNVALQAEKFAKQVDFFNIGTNDLIQYLLAVDRGNVRVAHLYNQRHPVMWQLIDQVIKDAHNQNIDVEVCGELASYPVAAACLLGLGIDGLSMNPADIVNVKKLLTRYKFSMMKKLADQTLRCDSLNELETLFEQTKNKHI